MSDLIERDAAIHEIMGQPPEPHYPSWYAEQIKALPPAQPKWIPCSERMPEEEYVLISKKPAKISGNKWSVTIAIRTADPRSGEVSWRDIGFGKIPDDYVLAWMPLPNCYQGDEK